MRGLLSLYRKRAAANKNGQTRRPPRRSRLMVEGLEQRTLLSITFSGPNNSGVATITGGPGLDSYFVQLKPNDPKTIEFAESGLGAPPASFVDATLSGITAVQVVGYDGYDQLTINAANGLVGQAANLPISYSGVGGLDMLMLQGTTTGTVTETFTQGSIKGSATLQVTDGTASSVINLTGVGKIDDTMTAHLLTIQGNDSNNFFDIHNGPVLNGLKTNTLNVRNLSVINSDLANNNQGSLDPQVVAETKDPDTFLSGTSESIHFANKTILVARGGAGNDFFLLSVSQPAAGLQSITLDGGGGTNVAALRPLPSSVSLFLKNFQVVEPGNPAAFIEQLYAERLGRVASQSEVASWMSVLNGSGGEQAVALAIENSPEARTMLVNSLYVRYLGRAAQNGEEQGWVALLMHGATEEQVIAGMLASPEFYTRAQTLIKAGTADQRYVQALYLVLLNRIASPGELSGWVGGLPALGRSGVALGFLESKEFRTGAITAFYTVFLQRAPDSAGLAAWAGSGLDLGHVRLGFELSAEYFNNG